MEVQKAEFWVDLFSKCDIENLTRPLALPDVTEVKGNVGQYCVVLSKGSEDDVHAGSEVFKMETFTPDYTQTCSCFIKILPRVLSRRQFHYANFMPHRELCIYSEVLPDLRRFLKEHNLDNNVMLPQPRLYYGELNEKANEYGCILAMENLQAKGFIQAKNVQTCFCDETHVRCVLKYLAYFHATSLAFTKKTGKVWSVFYKATPGQRDPLTAKYLKTVVSNVRKALARFSEQSAQKLGQIVAIMVEEPQEELSSSIMDCLLHGDSWINNYLFKYDEQDMPIDCATVDYQFARYGHPAFDIIQFLFTSVTSTLRSGRTNVWLQEYFGTFIETLKKLHVDVKGMNWQLFKKELDQKAFAGVVRACYALPVVMSMEKVNRSNSYDLANQDGDKKSPMEDMFRKNHSVESMANNSELMLAFSELIDEVLP